MSIRRPFPSQAPAARSADGNTVMSWQDSVVGDCDQFVPDGCCGVGITFWRPLICPVVVLRIRRGLLTTAAFCGAASGTLMTSIRHREMFSSKSGLFAAGPGVLTSAQPAIVVRTPIVPWT